MASIIKITPTLRGRDAVNFYKKVKSDRKISTKEVEAIKADAKKLRAILK